jgi:hypothetical protein
VLIETLAVAVAGAALGLGFAWTVLRLLTRVAAGLVPRLAEVGITPTTVIVVIGATVAATLVCGVTPMWHVVRTDHRQFLRGLVPTRRASVTQSTLVVIQLALAVVLLVSAGLLIRTVTGLLAQDHGFEAGPTLVARLVLSDTTLVDDDAHEAVLGEVLARIEQLPGVIAAGAGSAVPPRTPPITVGVRVVDDQRDEFLAMKLGSVTPGYQAALGARLLSGRDLEPSDAELDMGAVLLSESAARFFFPDQDPLGRQINRLPPIAGAATPRVVGVVSDVQYDGLDAPAIGVVYVPWTRRRMGTAFLLVRTEGDPMQLAPTVREVVAAVDPSLAMPELLTMTDVLEGPGSRTSCTSWAWSPRKAT